ncbi:SDR family NAD(P)-dependent oxidoreductase [Streptomyces sp. NPDC017248]|uniref:SDR family NAD(P)-dependent oxidoreductase n=1 Tax=unclassified Streptomyces TaxID=2593676 RepID=UPI0037B06CF3
MREAPDRPPSSAASPRCGTSRTVRPATFAGTAREAGAADPEQPGRQLALLIDGAAARTRVLKARLLESALGVELPAYAASKHGVLGITRALANAWSRHGIRVEAIAPGYTVTDLTRAHREDAGRAATILGRIPAGRCRA